MSRMHGARRRTPQSLLRSAACLAGALAAGLVSAQTTIHAHPDGSFDPTGSPGEPFATLRSASAAAAEKPAATVRLAAGRYHEFAPWLPLREPMTLRSEGGVATIGDLGARATTFSVQTYNTHLFGGLPPLFEDILRFFGLLDDPFTWQEGARAVRIGQTLVDSDVTGVQEVWSSTLWPHLSAATGAAHAFLGELRGAGISIPPPFGHVPDQLHSGLGFISRLPLASPRQHIYLHETGLIESMSTKSYIWTRVFKDGVQVAIFNTHLQAGPESDPEIRKVRSLQLVELASQVRTFMIENPAVPVIIMGDLNIRGSGSPGSQYKEVLQDVLDDMGFIDAAREDYRNRVRNAVTTSRDNPLRRYFDSGATSDDRLDYVLYAPSFDGSTRLVLRQLTTIVYLGPTPLSEGGLTTRRLSDHDAVRAEFDLIQR